MKLPGRHDTGIDRVRRRFTLALGASSLLTLWPGLTAAVTGGDSLFLLVLLRGGLDGLHVLPPVGDGAYARARGPLAIADGLKLDATFALHPAMQTARQWYGEKQLLPVVAIAPPYRQRSHFDAQDCLENGTAIPRGARDGWLGRCVAALPGVDGLAVASVMPLAMRGSVRAGNWSPPLPEDVDPLLLQQLQPLYAQDTQLADAFAQAVQGGDAMAAGADARGRMQLPQALREAATRMARNDGPRIGFVEDSGWDTHRNQAPVLARKLAELDAGLAAARTGFGAAWARTTLLVVTEFGRTAAVNGTAGTDHGTGTVALLAGGTVRGGRIAGDWPGMGAAQLNDGRDVRATSDLRGLFKAVLATQLRLPEAALETRVFPDSCQVAPLAGVFA